VTSHHPSTSDPPKAVLFCPECGHESTVDGDWTVHEDAQGRRVDCPTCGTTITTRRLAPALVS